MITKCNTSQQGFLPKVIGLVRVRVKVAVRVRIRVWVSVRGRVGTRQDKHRHETTREDKAT